MPHYTQNYNQLLETYKLMEHYIDIIQKKKRLNNKLVELSKLEEEVLAKINKQLQSKDDLSYKLERFKSLKTNQNSNNESFKVTQTILRKKGRYKNGPSISKDTNNK